ncbi:MAG: hemerythrin domain-containing protein [Micrococcales bacterium]|nr:hemerythrin domain-containing protein [Micrococcales bacterium]
MTITTHTDERPWIQEMVVVHRAFRREFPAAAAMVRRTAAGDTQRAKVVADHIRLGLAGLHMHHTGEDVLLWPLLLERAAPSTGLVETMQAQHYGVEARTEAILPALDAWQARPTRASGEHLAALIYDFAAALFEHLDLEEREILPLAERYVTAAEWNQLANHGKDSMRPNELPIMFGLVLEEATPEERARLLANLPAPVRLLLRTVGAWQFARYVRRVRG